MGEVGPLDTAYIVDYLPNENSLEYHQSYKRISTLTSDGDIIILDSSSIHLLFWRGTISAS